MDLPGTTRRLSNRVRHHRLMLQLSQQDLARRAGLSRQTVNAVEGGRYVPNTNVALRLARVLGCRVEELFHLEDALIEKPARPAEPAGRSTRALVAEVKGRLIAYPLKADRALSEGFTSADGFLTATRRRSSVRLLVPQERLRRTALVMGCDPSLSLLSNYLNKHGSNVHLAWLGASSERALEAVAKGEAHLAGSHLRDRSDQDYNLEHARRVLGSKGGIVVALACWEQGLVVASSNPKGIRSVCDLVRPDIRFVNREVGAGTRQLLDELLALKGIPVESIQGYRYPVAGHLTVARTVLAGGADAGLTIRAAAEVFGLHFIPLAEARFDLVIPREQLEHPAISSLLELLQTRCLREEMAALPGYEVREMGTVKADYSKTARPPVKAMRVQESRGDP